MVELAKIQLETLFVFNTAGRILSTREPQATAGPLFMLIRSPVDSAWAVRCDVSAAVAGELNQLAREEAPLTGLRDAPLHAERYRSILGGRVRSGPAFTFPQEMLLPTGVDPVEEERLLDRHFTGWIPGEIRAGRAPVLAVMVDGFPVSVCFCARRSDIAAEAGVETVPGYRGQGFAPRVVAAWALAIRAQGLTPLYSTEWSNASSLAVARKLGLEEYAVDWSVSG